MGDKKYEGRMNGLSNEEYHAAPGVSSSLLKTFAMSATPAHFKANHLDKPAPSASLQRAFDFGTAVHAGFMEPDRFAEEYLVFDDAEIVLDVGGKNPRATNKYKEWRADYEEENKDKIILEGNDYARVLAVVSAMKASGYMRKLFSIPGAAEDSFFWDHGDHLCKCRPDYLRDDGFVLDIKTTDDASPAAFQKQAENLCYYIQAAHYLDGVRAVCGEARQFLFIVVEKTPPYGVAFYAADADMIASGRRKIDEILSLYQGCLDSGEWPCYPDGAQWLSRPAWTAGK